MVVYYNYKYNFYYINKRTIKVIVLKNTSSLITI